MCYGVQVDKVWSEDLVPLRYPLPMDEDTLTLQQAIGTSKAWPAIYVVSSAIHLCDIFGSNKMSISY